MVIASKHNIPYLLDKPEVGQIILGEVYSVNDVLFKILDDFEGHPNYYLRREEPIRLKKDNSIVKCWTYFLPTFKEEMLKLPFMNNYSSTGDHGRPCSYDDDISDIEDIEIC